LPVHGRLSMSPTVKSFALLEQLHRCSVCGRPALEILMRCSRSDVLISNQAHVCQSYLRLLSLEFPCYLLSMFVSWIYSLVVCEVDVCFAASVQFHVWSNNEPYMRIFLSLWIKLCNTFFWMLQAHYKDPLITHFISRGWKHTTRAPLMLSQILFVSLDNLSFLNFNHIVNIKNFHNVFCIKFWQPNQT
jgi:hypothetical protein